MVAPILRPAGLATAAFYAAFFACTGVHMPFWPLWLTGWGLTPAEVAGYTAIGIGVRVVAGIAITSLADRLARWREMVVICALAGAAIFLTHLAITTRPVLLAATVGTGVVFAGLGPLSEALGVAAARLHHFPYGQARGIGSLGFLAMNLVVGAAMTVWGTSVALWCIVASLTLVAMLGAVHPGSRAPQRDTAPRMREIGRVILEPTFAIFLVGIAFSQASHAPYYALASVRWHDLGLSETRIGALWAFSVGVEVVLMVVAGGFIMTRVGPVRAMAIGAAAGIVRWGFMMTDPTGLLLWPIQAMHALTFATSHLGAMAFIAQAIPQRYGAAAQGASGTMATGLTLALATAGAAAVYPMLGGYTFGIGVVFSTIGLTLILWLARRWNGTTLVV